VERGRYGREDPEETLIRTTAVFERHPSVFVGGRKKTISGERIPAGGSKLTIASLFDAVEPLRRGIIFQRGGVPKIGRWGIACFDDPRGGTSLTGSECLNVPVGKRPAPGKVGGRDKNPRGTGRRSEPGNGVIDASSRGKIKKGGGDLERRSVARARCARVFLRSRRRGLGRLREACIRPFSCKNLGKNSLSVESNSAKRLCWNIGGLELGDIYCLKNAYRAP